MIHETVVAQSDFDLQIESVCFPMLNGFRDGRTTTTTWQDDYVSLLILSYR